MSFRIAEISNDIAMSFRIAEISNDIAMSFRIAEISNDIAMSFRIGPRILGTPTFWPLEQKSRMTLPCHSGSGPEFSEPPLYGRWMNRSSPVILLIMCSLQI